MSEEKKQITEMIEKREHDAEIMQLLLKHNITRKRAEYKLLIMYYKVCNMMSKAKLMMLTARDEARLALSEARGSGNHKILEEVEDMLVDLDPSIEENRCKCDQKCSSC